MEVIGSSPITPTILFPKHFTSSQVCLFSVLNHKSELFLRLNRGKPKDHQFETGYVSEAICLANEPPKFASYLSIYEHGEKSHLFFTEKQNHLFLDMTILKNGSSKCEKFIIFITGNPIRSFGSVRNFAHICF